MKEFLQIFSETNVDPEFLEYELAVDSGEFFFENGCFQNAIVQSYDHSLLSLVNAHFLILNLLLFEIFNRSQFLFQFFAYYFAKLFYEFRLVDRIT